MKPKNILKKGLYAGLAVVGAAMLTGTAIAGDISKRNVREQIYDCLEKFDGKKEYHKTIDDYEITVNTGKYNRCLDLKIKNLKTDNKVNFLDFDDDNYKEGLQLGEMDRLYVNDKEMPKEELSQYEQIMDAVLSKISSDLKESAITYLPEFKKRQRQEKQEKEKILKELEEAFK